MIPQRTMTRFAATVLLATAYFALTAASVGCGGGSGTTSSGPVALFTPDTPAPAAGTIALLAGSSSGASANVRVTVTGVAGFFGAAFRITYDPAALQFNSMDSSGSFLRVGVTDSDVIFFEDHARHSGEVVVTATRKDPTVAGPVDVVATSDLVVLNFTARTTIAAAAPEGRLEFGDPKQVCDGTVVAGACGTIAVTWSGGGVSAR